MDEQRAIGGILELGERIGCRAPHFLRGVAQLLEQRAHGFRLLEAFHRPGRFRLHLSIRVAQRLQDVALRARGGAMAPR